MSRPIIVQVFLSRSSVEAEDPQKLEPPARMRKLLCKGVDSVLARMRSESPLPQIVTRSHNASNGKGG
jgi:hypothetical protein